MDIEVRPVGEAEYEAYGRAICLAFGVDYKPEEQDRERRLIPLEETLAAFEGAKLVGTEGAFRMTLSIPGARVPMAGITSVSVLPTHHRRGILTAMMRARLAAMHEQGEWLAGLWASESVIYGRFGYGVASERAGLEIETSRAAFAAPFSDPGAIRLVERQEALRVIPPIFAAAAADWPGTIDRDERWWQHLWHDPKEDRGGRTGLLFAVHATAGTDGTDDGYAVYRTRLSWGTGADSELSLEELVSGSVIAYTALWRFLLDVDLMPRLVAYRRPVDEPLRWMLAERRLVRTRIDEALWLRLVDVAAALAARRYSAEGSVVIEVVDAFCPWNAGTLELDVGPDGARCRPTSKAADLTATAADLAAVYLGGVSVATLARAGRILEQAAGAGARADELFRWSRAPWCDRLF